MPATWAHAIIAFPIKKRFPHLSISALICGSMGPDLTMFTPFIQIERTITHSMSNTLVSALPMALFLYLFFHRFLADPILRSLPHTIVKRPNNESLQSVLISLVIGVYSHILWDMFTHDTMFIARQSSFLLQRVTLLSHSLTVAHLLQYISSLGGTVLLSIIGLRHYKNSIIPYTLVSWRRTLPMWTSILVSTLTTVAIVGMPSDLSVSSLHRWAPKILAYGSTILVFTFLIVEDLRTHSKRVVPGKMRGNM